MRELQIFSHQTKEPLGRLILSNEGEVFGDHVSLPVFHKRKLANPILSNEQIFDTLHGYSNGYIGYRESGKDHPQFPLSGGIYENLPQNAKTLEQRRNRPKSMDELPKAASAEEQRDVEQES